MILTEKPAGCGHRAQVQPARASARAGTAAPQPPHTQREGDADRHHQRQRDPRMAERRGQAADHGDVLGDRGGPVADRLRRGVEQGARAAFTRCEVSATPAPVASIRPELAVRRHRGGGQERRRGSAAGCAGPRPNPRPGSCRRRTPLRPARRHPSTHGDCVACSASGSGNQPKKPAMPTPNTVRYADAGEPRQQYADGEQVGLVHRGDRSRAGNGACPVYTAVRRAG